MSRPTVRGSGLRCRLFPVAGEQSQQAKGVRPVTESISNRLPSGSVADPATTTPIPTRPLVSKRTRRITVIVGVIAIVVVVVAVIGLGYLAYTSYDVPGAVPATVRLRDISFIVMAIETLILMILVLIVIVLLLIVIVLVYDRVIPILEQMNKTINTVVETAHTVRGTTTFVSEKVVSPFIQVSSYAAGVVRIAKEIAGLWPNPKRSSGEQSAPESDR